MILIGIESSCDETAAAVVRNGNEVLSSVVASQVEVHHKYGGVVPELASRKHVESIVPVVHEAISKAKININQLDGVAVTQGPGLIGSLLVGFSFAKGFALSHGLPVIGINHLEGHINSIFLNSIFPKFPFVSLLVSGGHTNIYYVTSHCNYELMGRTRDDAVGEAYDKVAKMLGLGYPGGAIIEKLSKKGDPFFVTFKRPFLDKNGFDFSFSGIKSAVNRYVSNSSKPLLENRSHIAASFQEAVIEVLVHKIINASITKKCKSIAIVGGVAANKELGNKVKSKAEPKNIGVYIPPVDLCGDNAAMIAAVGYHRLRSGEVSSTEDDVFSRN